MSKEVLPNVTRLVPVETKLHGEGVYLVSVEEFSARESQVYALAAKHDELAERAEKQAEEIRRLYAVKGKLENDLLSLRRSIARLIGAAL